MSLTHAQMQSLWNETRPLIEGSSFEYCCAATENKIVLFFQNDAALLISFKDPFLRFHLTQHPWKDHPLPFTKKLNQSIQKWHLKEFKLKDNDRVLIFRFEKEMISRFLICELIPRRANAYLIDHENHIIACLKPSPTNTYEPPNNLSFHTEEPKEILSSADVEHKYKSLEHQNAFEEQKSQVESLLKNQLKAALRGQQKFAQELESALSWEELQHEATLLQSHLYKITPGMKEVLVSDWSQNHIEKLISLDPNLSASEEIAQRFQKSKKLKRAIDPLKRQVEQNHKKIQQVSKLLEEVQGIDSSENLKLFCQKNYLPFDKAAVEKIHKPLPALPYREFTTASGLKIWVGKSAHDNDQLTFSYAHGSDYWLHARDVPGSHVILRLAKNQEPDQESLNDAMHAALFYSKAKEQGQGEVCVTQCKYVTRFGKNMPGKVQISQHRVAFIKMDLNRLKVLKERKTSR